MNRGSIAVKLLDYAFNSNLPFELFDYMNAYTKDAASEMDKLIKEAFKNMWLAEWEDGREEFQRDDQAKSVKALNLRLEERGGAKMGAVTLPGKRED